MGQHSAGDGPSFGEERMARRAAARTAAGLPVRPEMMAGNPAWNGTSYVGPADVNRSSPGVRASHPVRDAAIAHFAETLIERRPPAPRPRRAATQHETVRLLERALTALDRKHPPAPDGCGCGERWCAIRDLLDYLR